MDDAVGDRSGLGQPIEGMLAASRARRREALEHLMSATVELSLAAKAVADALERAVEYGRAWMEADDDAADGERPPAGASGGVSPSAPAWVEGLERVQRAAAPAVDGLARSLGDITAAWARRGPGNGSTNGSARGMQEGSEVFEA